MHIEIKKVTPDGWVALCADLDPRVSHPPLVTGKTLVECIQNLEQWEKGRIAQGLTANDPPFKDESTVGSAPQDAHGAAQPSPASPLGTKPRD